MLNFWLLKLNKIKKETILLQNKLEILALILSCFINAAAVITLIKTAIGKAKSPNETQNKRLDNHEIRLNELEVSLKKERKRIDNLEDGQRILMKAILALLAHGIDGNAIDKMQSAKDALEEFLIEG